MKTPAKRRLSKELSKRAGVARHEKKQRLLQFLILSGVEYPTRQRLAYVIFRQKGEGRVSHCRHHCFLTGRGRSVYRHFRLTRNAVRELAHRGQIYGLRKASW